MQRLRAHAVAEPAQDRDGGARVVHGAGGGRGRGGGGEDAGVGRVGRVERHRLVWKFHVPDVGRAVGAVSGVGRRTLLPLLPLCVSLLRLDKGVEVPDEVIVELVRGPQPREEFVHPRRSVLRDGAEQRLDRLPADPPRLRHPVPPQERGHPLRVAVVPSLRPTSSLFLQSWPTPRASAATTASSSAAPSCVSMAGAHSLPHGKKMNKKTGKKYPTKGRSVPQPVRVGAHGVEERPARRVARHLVDQRRTFLARIGDRRGAPSPRGYRGAVAEGRRPPGGGEVVAVVGGVRHPHGVSGGGIRPRRPHGGSGRGRPRGGEEVVRQVRPRGKLLRDECRGPPREIRTGPRSTRRRP
mmetsp:Transcript_33486/g.66162  ORF Transcript_33486/g.66162 Transcript_33486/m.66162 type:complete len:354 (-) Transcript_33486:439-1500(-)